MGFMTSFDFGDIPKITRFQPSDELFDFRIVIYGPKNHNPAPSDQVYFKKSLISFSKLLSKNIQI